MRTHHHKGAQSALQQQHRNNTIQPYNNQFYFSEVNVSYMSTYMYKSLYHQIRLKDFFPPPTKSDAFLSFSYRYNKGVQGTL